MTYVCSARGISLRATLSSARAPLQQLFVRRGISRKKKRAKKRRREAASKKSGVRMKRGMKVCFLFLPARTTTCMKSRMAPNRPRTVANRTDQTSDTAYALTHGITISQADAYLLRTIKSLENHHRLKAVGPYRDARVNASRRRRLRDAHRIRSWMNLQMPRRRRLMARARLRMGMLLARLVTVDSTRVCEHDIVLLR